MYEAKQTRTYPLEYTVSRISDGKLVVTFHGEEGKPLADEYAASMNANAATALEKAE